MLAVFLLLLFSLNFTIEGSLSSIGLLAMANIGVAGVVKDEETLDTENNAGEVKLTMKDFAKVIGETVNTALKEYTDKVDRKYMKLPESELSETEKQGKSQRQVDNMKFRKFLKNVVFTKALNTEGTDSQGGYLVPDEYEMEVIKLLNDYGLFRQKCRVKSMGGKTFKQPKLLTGVTATFTNEAAAATESNPTFSQIVWTAKKLDVVTGLSQEFEVVDIAFEGDTDISVTSETADYQLNINSYVFHSPEFLLKNYGFVRRHYQRFLLFDYTEDLVDTNPCREFWRVGIGSFGFVGRHIQWWQYGIGQPGGNATALYTLIMYKNGVALITIPNISGTATGSILAFDIDGSDPIALNDVYTFSLERTDATGAPNSKGLEFTLIII